MSRRQFIKQSSALGAGSLLGLPGVSRAEPPPETKTITMIQCPAMCLVPQYLVSHLLRSEGFEDIRYVKLTSNQPGPQLASGEAHFSMDAIGPFLRNVDAGLPVTALAGIHLGCYVLFVGDHIRGVRALKGKTVPVSVLDSAEHVFLSSMLAYVGIDPGKDVNWIVRTPAESLDLLSRNEVDAYLAFPPEPQIFHDRKVGRVLVHMAIDRPWSDYYCCILTANAAYVQRFPTATKRAVRAFLKAADLCVEQPDGVARSIVDQGFAGNYDYVLRTLREIRYDAWRSYDMKNSLRFYALRLREAGMIGSLPDKLIAQGANLKFLEEVKRELKS